MLNTTDSLRHLPANRQGPIRSIAALIGFLTGCFFIAWLGTQWTDMTLDTWYPQLVKPSFNPPNWIFGPVWSALYAMMAVAAWLVWRQAARPVGPMVWVPFVAQLALNAAWSGIFFALQSPGWALAEIFVLWLAIAANIALFWRVSRAAGLLLVPYLAWVSFASVLNAAIWRLN